jgi:hypothetical protein
VPVLGWSGDEETLEDVAGGEVAATEDDPVVVDAPVHPDSPHTTKSAAAIRRGLRAVMSAAS